MDIEHANTVKWYCVRTQPKREHLAANHLRLVDDVEVFCPRLRYRKATLRGNIWWVEPLFPGYILAKFDLSQRERAVTYSQGIRGLVKFGGGTPSIPPQAIEALRQQFAANENTEAEILTLGPDVHAGDQVEIAVGPLCGIHGVIVSVMPAQERVKVLLDFIGGTQVVDLDLYSILHARKPIPR